MIAPDTGYSPANDALEYDYLAQAIAAGEDYPRTGYLLQGGPTAVRGPGYPYLLGGVYALSGDSRSAGRLAGAALGALAVLLLYLLVKRIWGRRVGLVAATMAAVFPPLVLLSQELLSESLFVVLELAALLCVLNFRRSGGLLRWAVAAGAMCGLALLTRNIGLALIPAVAFGTWTARPRLGPRALLAPVAALVAAALVIAPWTLRNAAEFGRFIPVTTSTGLTAAGVYNETSFRDSASHGAWRDPQIVSEFTPLFATPGIDEGDVDERLLRAARNFAWQHPGYVAETFGWNLLRMFEIATGSVVDRDGHELTDRGIGSATPPAERAGLAIVAVLGLLGVIALIRSKAGGPQPRIPRGPLFLWLVPVLTLISTALLNGLPRDRIPIDPFLLILAAIGLVSIWDAMRRAEAETT